MRLVDQIEAAGLSPEVAETFRRGLEEVLAATRYSSMEHELVTHLFQRLAPEGTGAAPFDELWPHAELFVTAAIWVAVSDGVYGVEEARVIAGLAHRLGFGAAELAAMEAGVYARARGKGK